MCKIPTPYSSGVVSSGAGSAMAPPPFLNILSNHDEKCSIENLLLNDGTTKSVILTTPLIQLTGYDIQLSDCDIV